RLEVAAVGNQRVVGRQLLLDRLGLEDALDAQHLLNLILHRESILERQRRIRSHGNLPLLLVLEHFAAEGGALAVVLLEAEQIRRPQFLHRPILLPLPTPWVEAATS